MTSKTVLIGLLYLGLGGQALAQQFTLYGVGGFVYDPIAATSGTHSFPAYVPPEYGTIGGSFPVGTYSNGSVKVSAGASKSTNLGTFGTPVPAEVGPGGNAIMYNNTAIGNFGFWTQQITIFQYNWGVYFGGVPTTYGTPALWQTAIDGTYTGKAFGFFPAGYYLTSAQGNVNIQISGDTVTVQFNISDESPTRLNYCKGITTAGPQGFALSCSGSGQDNLYNNTYTMTLVNFGIGGYSQSLFFGLNAQQSPALLPPAMIPVLLMAADSFSSPLARVIRRSEQSAVSNDRSLGTWIVAPSLLNT